MKIDIQKANHAIDAYIAKLRKYHASTNKLTSSLRSNYVTAILMHEAGLIDRKKIDLDDHLVLFTACIAVTKRAREVWRIENECEAVLRRGRKPVSHETFVRRLKDPRSREGRTSCGERFRKHLNDTLGTKLEIV